MSGSNRALHPAGRAYGAPERPTAGPPAGRVYTGGFGTAALLYADSVARMAERHARQDVTPDMEPDSPSLTSGEGPDQFDDAENDHVPEAEDMEPFDATIESALRAEVTGDESAVTITADEGEQIIAVTEEDSGDLEVLIEDTSDVLLSSGHGRTIVEGDESEITITAEPGEVLDVSELDDGTVIVDVVDA